MQTHTDPIRGREVPVRDSRAGMALLIVLGLLALLMITGVAFTILMRIERASASNLRHTSAARQMAKGALAYAIAAINADIGANRYPAWTNRLYAPAGHDTGFPNNRPKLHIPEEIFFSVDEEKRYFNEVTEARVLTAETARYLPGALRHRAEMIRGADGDYARPEWIPVTTGVVEDIVGRYAFVALNTSGLLDANCVHTNPNPTAAVARWMGADPGELQLDPAVQRDFTNVLKFTAQRLLHGRYETTPELATLNTGVNGPALANADVFSYAVPDLIPATSALNAPGEADARAAHQALRTATRGRRIDIGTEARIKAQQNNILLAFRACGLKNNATFSAAAAKWAYLGLLDYVDADNEPAGGTDEEKFARPATEAMPLFSLVMLNIRYEHGDNPDNVPDPDDGIVYATHRMTYQHAAVFAYPFEKPAGPFKAEAKIMCAIWSDDADWMPLVPPLGADGMPAQVTLSQDDASCNPGGIVQLLSQPVSYPPVGQPPLKLPKSRGAFSDGHIEMVAGGATYNDKGVLLRKVPVAGYESGVQDSMLHLQADLKPQDITWAKGDDGATYWCEVIDPRYNHLDGPEAWRASRDDTWVPASGNALAPLEKLDANNILPDYVFYPPGTPTPSPQPNTGTYGTLAEHMLTTPAAISDYFKVYVDGMRVGDADKTHCDPITQQVRAHVADRPLQSVGELGYLPVGLWLTINLYDHGHTIQNLNNNNYKNNTLPSIGYHPVLDYFVIGDPDKGRRGLVNLNSRSPGVLGALFSRLPVQSEANTDSLQNPEPWIVPRAGGSCNDAVELAEWLIAKGPFDRLSDLGRFFKDTPQLGVDGKYGIYSGDDPLAALQKAIKDGYDRSQPKKTGNGSVCEFEREALIRNICNLVTVRGQTFTIILRADAFSPRFGKKGVKQGNVLATAMAVAQVWRDTEPMVAADGTKNYPTFVQFFKILNE